MKTYIRFSVAQVLDGVCPEVLLKFNGCLHKPDSTKRVSLQSLTCKYIISPSGMRDTAGARQPFIPTYTIYAIVLGDYIQKHSLVCSDFKSNALGGKDLTIVAACTVRSASNSSLSTISTSQNHIK